MEDREGNNEGFLLVFKLLNLSGLHTNVFRCSATTVACLDLDEPACVWGLPMNLLLLLLKAVGVVSAALLLDSGKGENNLEYLAFRGSLTNDCRPIPLPFLNCEVEGWSGVEI